jgi:hypothetical protein
MNSLLDEEEQEGKTSEITLSTASLLGIDLRRVLWVWLFHGPRNGECARNHHGGHSRTGGDAGACCSAGCGALARRTG